MSFSSEDKHQITPGKSLRWGRLSARSLAKNLCLCWAGEGEAGSGQEGPGDGSEEVLGGHKAPDEVYRA